MVSTFVLTAEHLPQGSSSCRMDRAGESVKVQLPASPSPQISGDKPCGTGKKWMAKAVP